MLLYVYGEAYRIHKSVTKRKLFENELKTGGIDDPFASQIETYKVDLELLSSKQEIPVWYDSQPH